MGSFDTPLEDLRWREICQICVFGSSIEDSARGFTIQVTLKTAVHESILKHGNQNKASKAKRTRVWIFYPFIAEEQNYTMSTIPFIKIILLLAFNKTKRGYIAKISR